MADIGLTPWPEVAKKRRMRATNYKNRKDISDLVARGYEKVGESGGLLWQIYRGARVGQVILDAVVAPDGMSVYVKIGPRENASEIREVKESGVR